MKTFVTICFLLIFTLLLNAQDKTLALTPEDFPDAEFLQSENYDGNGLWGYIDGGADIFLEYGFEKLSVIKLNWRGQIIKIEIYKMIEPESAFGIFSVHRFKCEQTNQLCQYFCSNSFQVQFAKGNFYVSIINERENQETQIYCRKIAEKILSKIKAKDFVLPQLFNVNVLSKYKDQVKFLKGRLGLQNGFPDWSEWFITFNNFKLYLLPIEIDDGYLDVSKIHFSDEGDLLKFYNGLNLIDLKSESWNKNNINGEIFYTLELNELDLILIKQSSPSSEFDKIIQSIKIVVK